MTIDERLQFLIHSTESLHANIQDLVAAQTAALAAQAAAQAARDAAQEERNRLLDAQMLKLTNVMAAIASTVLEHEERLNELEEK